ncbi:MAG: hypothetical protein LBD48_13615 [Treponema sp.]|nr:hypothetical protein [Treponema sp.]
MRICRIFNFFFVAVLTPSLWGNPAAGSIETVYNDPFLLYFLRNGPTLDLNRSGNVSIKDIRYRDFKNKIIDYGDADPGTEQYSSYLFRNQQFYGIDRVNKDEHGIHRYKEVEMLYNADGSITVKRYMVGSNRFIQQDDYRWSNGVLIANEGLRFAMGFSVVKKDDTHYYYYDAYGRYQSDPDKPEITIALQDNQVTVTVYSYTLKKIVNVLYFTDGILMKTEDQHGRVLSYTVSNGIGEIVVTINGKVTEVKKLERRINGEGFLEYESVQNADGSGSEWVCIQEE